MMPDNVQYQIFQSVANDVTWDFIVRIITVLVSLVNLGIVYFIYHSTRDFSIRSIRFEKQAVWYRELAIQPNLEKINCFYRDVSSIVENGQNEILKLIKRNDGHQTIIELTQKIVGDFNAKIFDLRKEFVDIVSALNPEFGNKINYQFDELQDLINPQIAELISKPDQKPINISDILRRHKVKLFKMKRTPCALGAGLLSGFPRDGVPWSPAGSTPCGAKFLYNFVRL